MVRPGLLRLSLAACALFGARPVLAAPITFTGFVQTDFSATNPNVTITPVSTSPSDIGPAQFMVANGWVSGWAVKDIRTSYNATTDVLSVGVNTFVNSQGKTAIVGDSDGNGDPGGASAQMAAAGGIDNPNLGGHKSVAIAFAPNDPHNASLPGIPVVVAGVPADKATAGTGLDGFKVASYKGTDLGLGYNFGTTLTANLGTLAFNPSALHPGFEFTINNFSKVAGLNPSKGFWMQAYAGSPDDVIAGESALSLTRIPAISEENLPEPAALLAWSLVAGGAVALRLRNQIRR
jgi:hypothetical protein